MRNPLPPNIESCRVTTGRFASNRLFGCNGLFHMTTPNRIGLRVMISDGLGWEHVSVSLIKWETKKRVPTWEEMCWIKDQFFYPEEVVIQYHPAKSKYVNLHPYCLHLWRPTAEALPVPPLGMV